MNRSAKRGTVFVLMGLSLVLAACGPLASTAAGEGVGATESDTISVVGVGKVRADPDMATVTIGVNVADEAVSNAVSESNTTIERITAAVEAFGVDPADIQTVNFSIWAEEQWDPQSGQRQEERLYRVDSTLQVNLRQVDRMGELLETAIENGANNIYGLSFGIQDSTALADEARSAAVEDAERRAGQIAQSLGVTLGDVVSVAEVRSGTSAPQFETAAMGLGGGAGEPPISEGSMSVSVSLDVTYEIER